MTEITLNTNESEIAVCNLGSVNLVHHLKPTKAGGLELDHAKLKTTIGTAMRMLDNVIDINYYAVAKARNANLRHRPVGLGIMGSCMYFLVTVFQEWVFTISVSAIIGSVMFSAFVGLFFGIWPARKAAQLEPAVALRYE